MYSVYIDPVNLQQVEGLQDGIGDTTATVEGVEDGDTVCAADHRLAVQGEGPRLQLGRSVRDSRIAFGPVIAAAGEQPELRAACRSGRAALYRRPRGRSRPLVEID